MKDLDFNLNADKLFNSIRKWGCDEKVLLEISLIYNSSQRQALMQIINIKYNISLIDLFENDVTGELGKILKSMYIQKEEFIVNELISIFDKKDPDYESLIEILLAESNIALPIIKKIFYKGANKEISESLSELPNKKIVNALIDYINKENFIKNDINQLEDIVYKLIYSREQENQLEEERILLTVISNCSKEEIELFYKYFLNQTGKTIYNIIDEDFENDYAKYLRDILLSQLNKIDYFTERINSLIGLKIDYKSLSRIVILRKEIDFKEIYNRFNVLYDKDLYEIIKEDYHNKDNYLFDEDYKVFLLYALKDYYTIKEFDVETKFINEY